MSTPLDHGVALVLRSLSPASASNSVTNCILFFPEHRIFIQRKYDVPVGDSFFE
jgi:hypothetical protein